jgi:hypothetical protein
MPFSPLLPELWVLIFRLATEVPGELDTSELPPLCDESRSWDLEFGSSLATKTSLALVSKLWNLPSLPLLYESVQLIGSRRLASVLPTLRRRPLQAARTVVGSESETFTSHLGCYTKRLCIVLPHHDKGLGEYPPLDNGLTISSLLPNIRVLLVLSYTRECNPLLIMFLDVHIRIAQNIRHLHFNIRQSGDILLEWLTHLPMLEVVTVADIVNLPNPADTISLPHLHTLEVRDHSQPKVQVAVPSKLCLPSLRRLTLTGDYGYPRPLLDFIDVFATQLTALDLKGSPKPEDLPSIIAKCTSLTYSYLSRSLTIHRVCVLILLSSRSRSTYILPGFQHLSGLWGSCSKIVGNG